MLLVFNVLQAISLIILILLVNYVIMLLNVHHVLLLIHPNASNACMATILLLIISVRPVLLIANLAPMLLSAPCLITTMDKSLCLMPMENLFLDNVIKVVGAVLNSTLDLVVSAILDILLLPAQLITWPTVFLAHLIA